MHDHCSESQHSPPPRSPSNEIMLVALLYYHRLEFVSSFKNFCTAKYEFLKICCKMNIFLSCYISWILQANFDQLLNMHLGFGLSVFWLKILLLLSLSAYNFYEALCYGDSKSYLFATMEVIIQHKLPGLSCIKLCMCNMPLSDINDTHGKARGTGGSIWTNISLNALRALMLVLFLLITNHASIRPRNLR